MSIFAVTSVQILLIKRPLLQALGRQQSDIIRLRIKLRRDKEFRNQMKSGKANVQRPIKRRSAVHLGRKISNATVSTILIFVVTAAAQSDRINQEGRILGPAPVVTTPTLFNTPQADAI